MKVFCFGIGETGSKLVDTLTEFEQGSPADFIVDGVACSTARADFQSLDTIPQSKQLVFGAGDTATDEAQAAELAEEDHRQLLRGTDDAPVSRADAFVICAGLGEVTSGASPVLAKHLKRVHDQPVYGIGVLPELEETHRVDTALRTLRKFVAATDHVIGADAETAGSTEAAVTAVTRRFGTLCAAGEGGDGIAESVVDASEIINTLRGGGVATLGYATSELPERETGGLTQTVKRLIGADEPDPVDDLDAQNRITTHTREALLGQLTFPCAVDSTSRGLVVVSGPPAWLNRSAIEQSRSWVEDETECLEIRGGDYPRPSANQIGVLVLLAGVSPAERIEALRAAAEGSEQTSE
ncbi:tubulin/FtsZ family protein [Haloferax larsenii]|uniref:Tubulin-like protein CetZ n=1 Tax=Haloferax larsenii TaxID=302484 RepID=A0A1H7UZC1_HALLR|nr:tubulin/FtsZ family protein [Haloferax larsenii]SEM02176.1 Cell division GTPase FtsZ [Haloferax larsenii]